MKNCLPLIKIKTMKVKNHKDFARFNYESEPCKRYNLGQILYRETEDGEEIGVVIQTFSDHGEDCRTDQWGVGDGVPATLEQIDRIRPELLQHIDIE